MKNQYKNEMVALAALLAAGAATYVLYQTYKAIKGLDNIDLDLSSDSVLSSIFKKG